MNCPTCSGPGVLLGYLGKLAWFRCRNCGMEFASDKEKVIEPEESET